MTFECPDCGKELQTKRGVSSHRSQMHGWTPNKEESVCKNCDGVFEYYPKEKTGVFCSKKCQLEYGEPGSFAEYRECKIENAEERKEESKCIGCSSIFEYDPKNTKGLFCSQECFYEHSNEYIQHQPGRNRVERIEKECFECGSLVVRLPSNISSDDGRVFCSQMCRGKWISQSHIFNSQRVYVEETKREVSSGWEAEIDRMLNSSDLQYGYETKTFELPNGRNYTPDFIVENEIIIEVKGQPSKSSYERSKRFMEGYGSNFFYIVIGTEMDCHLHLEWDRKDDLLKVIENAI